MKPSLNNEEIRSAQNPSELPRTSNTRILFVMGGIVCAAVAAIAAAMLYVALNRQTVAPSATAVTVSATEPVLVEFEKLKGKWLRPDGGYVLEIKKLLPDNALETAYYNPSPIHVGKAKLYKERGFVKVFVELQDVNYPGSTYTLIYDKANDQLCGVYYQATQQQEYQIAFERMPPGS